MTIQRAPTTSVAYRERASYARLHGAWLIIGWVSWCAVVAFTLAVVAIHFPQYLAQLRTPCAGATCEYQQLTPRQAIELQRIGLSLAGYATITIAVLLATTIEGLIVSALIMWRRSDDRMALFVAIFLMAWGPVSAMSSLPAGSEPWRVPHNYLTLLAQASLVLVFLLFPSGRFVPRWTRWMAVVLLIAPVIPSLFLPTSRLLADSPVSQAGWLVAVAEMAIVAVVQIYRYRRVSSPVERQQTKWIMFGLAAPIAAYVGLTLIGLLIPEIAAPTSGVYALAIGEFGFILPIILPLAFGFAMTRSHLWEIDVLINRTLVYGALTLILTAIFVGLVIGLQALLGGFLSQSNSIVIVFSTLAIAALFQPLRRRLQALIDRRFYRRKYDAVRTVAAFASALRGEVDLASLSQDLLVVVEETLQPTHASLWLSPSPAHRERDAR